MSNELPFSPLNLSKFEARVTKHVFDSGVQAKDFGGDSNGKKNTTIPASIDEFMSNSTAETPAFGAAIWKENQQGAIRQFDVISTYVMFIPKHVVGTYAGS